MLIGTTFDSVLNHISTKNNKGQIEKHFKLVFESFEQNQTFLDSLDDKFKTNITPNFTAPTWKNNNFKLSVSNLKLNFGGVEFNCDMTGIAVNQINKKKLGNYYKYTISFRKAQSQTEQSMKEEMMFEEFYQRKEPNAKGKMVLVKFKTLLTPLF